VHARTARLFPFEKSADEVQSESETIVKGNEMSAIPDDVLARRLQADDSEAFSLFFHRYAALIQRIAYGILRNRAEAEDVTQTVFWNLHRAIDRYDPAKGTLRTWLLQYAYHRALNHKKSLQQRGFYSTSELESADERVADPGGKMLSAEAAQAVRQGLALLSEDQRMTLQLIFLEGMEMEDVAHRLGQNVSNIRHHYYRGLRKLRDILGPEALSGTRK
jgi:RNA polymerase sigma-70 factor, ECF subfamily